MSSLRKRLGGNFFANIYAQLVSITYTLLTIPIFLSHWTVELYGEWLIISALPSYIALSNMGLMNVAQNNMTMAIGKGDVNSAKVSLHTVWGTQLGLNVIVILIVAASIIMIDIVKLFNFKTISSYEADYTLLILSIFALLNLQIGIFGGIYRAVGKNSRGVFVINTIRLINILAVAISLFLGAYNVLIIASIMSIVCMFGFIYIYYDSAKVAPALRPGISYFDSNELKSSIRLGLAFMSYPLGRAITNQGMLIFTNAYIGSASVVILSSLRTIVNVAFQISNLINLSTWPEFSRLYGAKEYSGVRRLFTFSTSIGFWSGIACAGGLLIFGPQLLEAWTRGEVIIERSLLSVYLLAIVLNSVWYTALTIFNATNRHKKISVNYLFCSLLVPTISWATFEVFDFGLYAIGIGFVFMELVMLFNVLPKALKLVSIKKKRWFINILTFPISAMKAKI